MKVGHCGSAAPHAGAVEAFSCNARRAGAIALFLCLAVSLGAGPSAGGGAGGSMNGPTFNRGIPTQAFLNHLMALYSGDYRDALEAFRTDLGEGVRTSQSRWIDSICYYTAMGEACYRMGRLGDALDNYNNAVKLYLAFPNWMQQVQFPLTIPARPNRQNIPWGHSSNNHKLGNVPSSMNIAQGQLYIDQQLQQGGVIAPPQLVPVNVYEIVRATALAIKRRGELMGIVCPHDKLTTDLVAVLARRPAPANHWSEAWVDLELGMAYLAEGQVGQAIPRLQASIVLDGQFDHPLTAMAELTLGQIALDAGDYDKASNLFEEASYSAVEYNDYTTLEEAFRYGQQSHLLANRPGVFKPLAAAANWAKRSNLSELRFSLLLLTAENEALLNHKELAGAALAEAKSVAPLHTMSKMGEIAARFHYLAALVYFQAGKALAGEPEIEQSITLERDASKWLFQIALADFFIKDHGLGAHRALNLYENLLRDPLPVDWASRPMETIAVMSTPHIGVYEHWFENTLESGMELSLEVADRTRRHRFFTTLPLGGRLLALRWTLEAPSDALDKQSQLQRQNLLAKYPKYDELAKQVRKLHGELAAAPLAAADAASAKKQSELLGEIVKLSAVQEVMLREMALRREASDLLFPPMYSTKDVQASLAPRQDLLIFFATHNNLYAWLMSKDRYVGWKIDAPQNLEKRISMLLRAMGNYDSTRELQQNQLDESWRPIARDLTETLTANAKASSTKINLSTNIDELIVVPDGALWYLPFEALQVSPTGANANKSRDGKDLVPLVTKSRIRYLPTMGLAMPERLSRSAAAQVGVVIGRLHPKDDADMSSGQFATLRKALPNASAIKGPLSVASPVYGSLFDSVAVFDDLATAKKGPYDWSPIPLDRTESQGTLAQWFSLPWKSPVAMILPGFHTHAETALRNMPSGQAGNEIFLTVCGLMSTGSRTILLSRWRVGGESTYDLIRQFIQELPFASAADAWQRSVQVLMDSPVDFDHEPRVRKTSGGEAITAHHPFFWAGYLLVDTGWSPLKSDKQAAPPVINLNAKIVPPMPMQKN